MYAKKFKSGLVLVFALAFLLHAPAAAAQQPAGTLRGQVVDPAGAVVPGATIMVTDAAGNEKTATTNGEGVYTVTLAPGKYTVRAVATGFGLLEGGEVEVTAGGRATLDLKLEVTVEENVDVRTGNGSLSVEPEANNSGLVLSGEDLKILSDDPDLLVDDLRALAGPGFGPNGTQFFVDGFSGGRLPPKTSIREVRINQNPFAAEQDALGFGRVEIFTRPGATQFNGQLSTFFSDESLNARNPLAPTKVPFQVRIFNANLTGPLGKKTSFFADVEWRNIDENIAVNARVLDAGLSPVAFGQAVVTPQRRNNLSGRIDHQINKDHTLVARYGFLRSKLDNLGVGGFALPSVAFDSEIKEHTLQLTETAVVNPRVLNETRFQFVHSRNTREGDSSSPTVEVQGAFVGGGAPFGLTFTDSDRYELNNVTTWAGGAHTVRFGGRFRHISLDDVAGQNFNGKFVFSSLEQYRQVTSGVAGATPAQLLINGGNQRVGLSQSDLGLFIQDDWRVRPNFMLSYGARFETQTNIDDRFDFAPRVSFAWGVGSTKQNTPKFVIRGGAGVFYYRFGEDLTLQAERFDGVNQQQLIITNPSFYPVIPAFDTLAGANATTVRSVAGGLRTPYVISEGIGVERQLRGTITLSATYIHQNSYNLVRSRNLNAPLPGTFIPGVPSSGVRPFPGVGNLFQFEGTGSSRSDGLVVNFRSRLSQRVMLFATSRFFREKTDTDGPFDFPANSFDTSGEYGYGVNDVRASVFLGSNISLPWNVSMSAFLRAVGGNRFNIITGRDTNGDAVFTERPAFATDLSKPGVVITDFGAFDPNPAPGQPLIPRNYGRGPGHFNVNIRATKSFFFGSPVADSSSPAAAPQPSPGPLPAATTGAPQPAQRTPGSADQRGRYILALSVQVQNLLNHTNAGPAIGNLSSPLFGQSNTLSGVSRRFDFNVRFTF